MATTLKGNQTTTRQLKSTQYETEGLSVYAVVHEPQIDKKYPTNADGSPKKPSYRITVKYSGGNSNPQLKALKANIKKYEIKKKLRALEDENGEETGEYTFTFERVAFTDESGNHQNPLTIVDADNNLLPKSTLIGNGSLVKVIYQAKSFNGPSGQGHSFQLMGVQVVDLVEYKPQPLFTPIQKSSSSEESSNPSSSPSTKGKVPTSF